MALVMENLELLLRSLRKNDWYITTFTFSYYGNEYVVIFEDLEALYNENRKYHIQLTFVDMDNERRRLVVKANGYDFNVNDQILKDYFHVITKGKGKNYIAWNLYKALNAVTPTEYHALNKIEKERVIKATEERTGHEGLCCFKAIRNGKTADGKQKYRSPENTVKTKILRPDLYKDLGEDKTISFCYRKNDEKSDAEILASFR